MKLDRNEMLKIHRKNNSVSNVAYAKWCKVQNGYQKQEQQQKMWLKFNNLTWTPTDKCGAGGKKWVQKYNF